MTRTDAYNEAVVDAVYSDNAIAVYFSHFHQDYRTCRYDRIQTGLQNFDAIVAIVDPYVLRRDHGFDLPR